MIKITKIFLIAILLFAGASAAAHQPQPENKPKTFFTIDIVGSPHFNDVNIIQSGLRRSDGIIDVTVGRQAEGFVRLDGSTHAKREHLLADLKGLAQDRFDMDLKQDQNGSLLITLRKLR